MKLSEQILFIACRHDILTMSAPENVLVARDDLEEWIKLAQELERATDAALQLSLVTRVPFQEEKARA